MSTKLYWLPTPKTKPNVLGHGLKLALERHFGHRFKAVAVTKEKLEQFLLGFKAAHIQGECDTDVDKLLAAFDRHGTLDIWVDE